jgi:short-subunit dehydrogenase
MKIAITGAGGSLAKSLLSQFKDSCDSIDLYSLSNFDYKPSVNVNHFVLETYEEIEFRHDIDVVIMAQGYFNFGEFKNIKSETISKLLNANLLSQIYATRNLITRAEVKKRLDVIFIGSTAIFGNHNNTVLYSTFKSALQTFSKALNDEYRETSIKFWYISMGTMKNRMGKTVPNQINSTLLDEDLVSKIIYDSIQNSANSWQPEISIQRRQIQTHD